jgi:hypothetical protein
MQVVFMKVSHYKILSHVLANRLNNNNKNIHRIISIIIQTFFRVFYLLNELQLKGSFIELFSHEVLLSK